MASIAGQNADSESVKQMAFEALSDVLERTRDIGEVTLGIFTELQKRRIEVSEIKLKIEKPDDDLLLTYFAARLGGFEIELTLKEQIEMPHRTQDPLRE
jgi:hypothetical protein